MGADGEALAGYDAGEVPGYGWEEAEGFFDAGLEVGEEGGAFVVLDYWGEFAEGVHGVDFEEDGAQVSGIGFEHEVEECVYSCCGAIAAGTDVSDCGGEDVYLGELGGVFGVGFGPVVYHVEVGSFAGFSFGESFYAGLEGVFVGLEVEPAEDGVAEEDCVEPLTVAHECYVEA